MDVDRLVDLVYKELMKKLNKETKQRSVCILSKEKIQELDAMLADSYNIVYFSKENNQASYDMVIIPQLSVSMLANLANGISATEEEQFILSQLLQGRKVIVLQDGVEYHGYKKQSPILLYKVYEEYEQKLTSFGIQFLERDELVGKPETVRDEKLETLPDKHAKLTKKLISEADLQKLYLQRIKEITIGSNSIITPLAQDFIRTHKLQILRESGESK